MGKLVYFKHNAQLLKQIVAVTKDVMTEVNIRFDATSVSIVGVDPEKTAVVQMRLDTTKLQSYEFSQTVTIGVFLGNLHKLLRNAPKDGTIEMVVYRDAPDVLVIRITGSGVGTEIRLKSLGIPVQNITIPSVGYDGGFYIPSVYLYRIARELNHVGTEMTVSTLPGEQIKFEACKDSTSDEVTVGPGLLLWDVVGEEFSEKYLGRYIEKLSKTQIDKSILVQFKKGHPLSFMYKFDEGFIRFLVAPIIQNNVG